MNDPTKSAWTSPQVIFMAVGMILSAFGTYTSLDGRVRDNAKDIANSRDWIEYSGRRLDAIDAKIDKLIDEQRGSDK